MSGKNKTIGNISVIYPGGRLNVNLTTDIEEEINLIFEEMPLNHLIVNLRDVEYLSSDCIRLFVSQMRDLNLAKREFILCNLSKTVKKILQIVELQDRFNLFDNEEDAVKYLKEKQPFA
ncbi:STAS domain-containing protein [Spirochaetota bacterium]